MIGSGAVSAEARKQQQRPGRELVDGVVDGALVDVQRLRQHAAHVDAEKVRHAEVADPRSLLEERHDLEWRGGKEREGHK